MRGGVGEEDMKKPAKTSRGSRSPISVCLCALPHTHARAPSSHMVFPSHYETVGGVGAETTTHLLCTKVTSDIKYPRAPQMGEVG